MHNDIIEIRVSGRNACFFNSSRGTKHLLFRLFSRPIIYPLIGFWREFDRIKSFDWREKSRFTTVHATNERTVNIINTRSNGGDPALKGQFIEIIDGPRFRKFSTRFLSWISIKKSGKKEKIDSSLFIFRLIHVKIEEHVETIIFSRRVESLWRRKGCSKD